VSVTKREIRALKRAREENPDSTARVVYVGEWHRLSVGGLTLWRGCLVYSPSPTVDNQRCVRKLCGGRKKAV